MSGAHAESRDISLWCGYLGRRIKSIIHRIWISSEPFSSASDSYCETPSRLLASFVLLLVGLLRDTLRRPLITFFASMIHQARGRLRSWAQWRNKFPSFWLFFSNFPTALQKFLILWRSKRGKKRQVEGARGKRRKFCNLLYKLECMQTFEVIAWLRCPSYFMPFHSSSEELYALRSSVFMWQKRDVAANDAEHSCQDFLFARTSTSDKQSDWCQIAASNNERGHFGTLVGIFLMTSEFMVINLKQSAAGS